MIDDFQDSVNVPPLLPPGNAAHSSPTRSLLATVLSLCLLLFLADGVISLADDSLMLFFNVHALGGIRLPIFLIDVLLGLLVYGLMALTPMIPKRFFLPVTLFNPLAQLIFIPFLIYFYEKMAWLSWWFSFCEVVFALGLLCLVQGGFGWRWPLVAERQLETRRFSWGNLCAFLAANAFVLLPAMMLYLGICAAVAVHHFTAGFMALHANGLTVQSRKYVREDGKTIQLFPMAHIGERDFYQVISQAFPTNSIVLMEGVTDRQNLLTNRITYSRMAKSLGLSEQQKEFKPANQTIRADVDIGDFSKETIDFLNVIMVVHSRGLNAATMLMLSQYPAPANLQEVIFGDILEKRNQHLLAEIHSQLTQTNILVVPWGVAHMPGVARELEKEGFHMTESRDYEVIRFHSANAK